LNTIKENLSLVYNRINEAAKKALRNPKDITLLAVSKGQNVEAIQEALAAGQKDFGENYLQEALLKINTLKDQPGLNWHFIGPIQSNKTKLITQNFDWVQSVDREKIAFLLNEHRPTNLPSLNICLQVNISGEASKSGVKPQELLTLAQKVSALPKLCLRGIMAIPAPSEDFNEQKKAFLRVFDLFEMLKVQGFKLDTLSMGMSDDLEAAIAAGSTLIRIGTAIFGPRNYQPLSNSLL